MSDKVMLSIGSIVQLDPIETMNKMFSGCFMTVTEPKPWGARGYVQALGENGEPGGQAYYRASWDEMSAELGKAQWVAS